MSECFYKNPFIFLQGKSNSGKSTQLKLLCEFWNSKYGSSPDIIQTGKFFRSISENTHRYTGNIIADNLENGKLLPEFLPIYVWSDFLINKYDGCSPAVFDGVCRKVLESRIMESAVEFYSVKAIVFHINISDEEVLKRSSERGREDDNSDNMREKLRWYEDNVVPAIKYMEDSPLFKVYNIDGERTPEEIHEEIAGIVKKEVEEK